MTELLKHKNRLLSMLVKGDNSSCLAAGNFPIVSRLKRPKNIERFYGSPTCRNKYGKAMIIKCKSNRQPDGKTAQKKRMCVLPFIAIFPLYPLSRSIGQVMRK